MLYTCYQPLGPPTAWANRSLSVVVSFGLIGGLTFRAFGWFRYFKYWDSRRTTSKRVGCNRSSFTVLISHAIYEYEQTYILNKRFDATLLQVKRLDDRSFCSNTYNSLDSFGKKSVQCRCCSYFKQIEVSEVSSKRSGIELDAHLVSRWIWIDRSLRVSARELRETADDPHQEYLSILPDSSWGYWFSPSHPTQVRGKSRQLY